MNLHPSLRVLTLLLALILLAGMFAGPAMATGDTPAPAEETTDYSDFLLIALAAVILLAGEVLVRFIKKKQSRK